MAKKIFWTPTIAPYQRISPGLVFTDKSTCSAICKDLNRLDPLWKGRGVRPARCDEFGQLLP